MPIESSTTTYTVTVDYGKSLSEMIADGRCGSADLLITSKRFPITTPVIGDPYCAALSSGTATIVLVQFDKMVSPNEAMAEIEYHGFLLGKLEHLLALGIAYPDLQCKPPIVALGSAWWRPRGSCEVPYLWEDSGRRRLSVDPIGGGWGEGTRFLAVRP